jgi:hypothetical protein
MVGFQQMVIQAAGLIHLFWVEEDQVAGVVLPRQGPKVQVVPVTGFVHDTVAQAFGNWACFSQGEGTWCNTKTTKFYFELPQYP